MKKRLFFGWCILAFLLLFLAGCGNNTQEEKTESVTGADTAEDASLDPDTGCTTEYLPICGTDGLTYQNSCYSSLRDIGVKSLGVCEYTVCSFNDIDHYMMNNMIYHEDDRGRPYIDVLYGTFYQKSDGSDGWIYYKAINKESSYYYNRIAEYQSGFTESGAAITCETTTELPANLKEFLKTHGKILKLKIEGYEEDDVQQGINQKEEILDSEEATEDTLATNA